MERWTLWAVLIEYLRRGPLWSKTGRVGKVRAESAVPSTSEIRGALFRQVRQGDDKATSVTVPRAPSSLFERTNGTQLVGNYLAPKFLLSI